MSQSHHLHQPDPLESKLPSQDHASHRKAGLNRYQSQQTVLHPQPAQADRPSLSDTTHRGP